MFSLCPLYVSLCINSPIFYMYIDCTCTCMDTYMYIFVVSLSLYSCQFIVREGKADYTVHSVDPDLLVEWDCIEQLVSISLYMYIIDIYIFQCLCVYFILLFPSETFLSRCSLMSNLSISTICW